MNKKLLIITISIVAVCVALFFANQICQKNKEQIVDLGNGWKSYSHEEIGITVKIPEDAEAVYSVEGDKKDSPWASFSKGPVSSIRAWTSFGFSGNSQKGIELYLENFGPDKKNENNWENFEDGNRRREFSREFKIKDETVLVDFYEFEDNQQGILTFRTEAIVVVGKTRTNNAFLEEGFFSVKERITEDRQHFTEDEIETYIQKHVDLINDYIILINTF